MTPNEREQAVLTLWKTEGTFAKIQSEQEKLPPFVIYEGPPTANGKPGIHHVLTRTYKDAIARYKSMRGYYVRRKAGWDEHGLPVEIEIQKRAKLETKADVEAYGVEKFNKKCQESTRTYIGDWTALTERMGYWLDFERAYRTSDHDYIKKVWAILTQMYNNGLVYQDFKVVPWATDSLTVMSNAEVGQGYKEVTDTSAYVMFEIEHDNKFDGTHYMLAWTTTPWTLPANMALAVNPDADYNFNMVDGKTIISLSKIGEEQVGTIKGSHLVGRRYAHPFRLGEFKVYGADFVKKEKTGIVHIAPAFGEDDYNLFSEQMMKQDIYCHVEPDGWFNITAPACLYGRKLNFKESNEIVLNFFKGRGWLHATEEYTHEYPHNWRTGVPLIYYLRKSWFVKTTDLPLEAANEKVKWFPENVKNGRFGQWLKGGKDWAISRERWWATPLPFYTNGFEWIVANPPGYHKPEADFPQAGYVRDPAVLDCWFDSGCVPWAGYDVYSQADVICEGLDQTRGWFYSLLCIGTAITGEAPYKAAVCLGHVLDKDGQKMSKSKGNGVDPWKVFEKHGADAVRWFMLRTTVGLPILWNEAEVAKVERVFFNRLLNCAKFWTENKPVEGEHRKSDPTDNWIFARSWELTKVVTELMEEYEFSKAAEAIEQFVDDLSNVWIRANRQRFVDGDQMASDTLHSVLWCVSVLMAPFAPFIAEHIWKQIGCKGSVHEMPWPTTPQNLNEFQTASLEGMKVARQVVAEGMRLRDEKKIRVRQALAVVYVPTGFPKEYHNFVKGELNVKDVVEGEKIDLDTNVTKELEHEGMIRDLTRAVQAERKNMGLKRGEEIFLTIQNDPKNTDPCCMKNVLYVLQNKLDLFRQFCHSVSCKGIVYDPAKITAKVGDGEIRFTIRREGVI